MTELFDKKSGIEDKSGEGLNYGLKLYKKKIIIMEWKRGTKGTEEMEKWNYGT